MLSTGMEWAQAYTVDRRPDLWDVCANTVGAFLGATVGAVYGWAQREAFWGYTTHRPYVLLLLSGWLGYQLLGSRMGITAGGVSALGVFQRCVIWLAVGLLVEALVGVARSRGALALLTAGVVALQWVFAGMVPSAQVLSGAIAVALWSTIICRVPRRGAILAGLFVVHVVLVALAPFHFLSSPRHFQVIPFVSFLYNTRGDGARSFSEKAFTYGTLVWVLVRAGWTLRRSTVAAVALVVFLRAAQVYLPGRSAEITDALITLAMAGTMKLLGDRAQASGDAMKRYPMPRTVSR